MRKILPMFVILAASALICAFALVGCAGNQAQSTNTVTIDEALEKSAAARQKIKDAKRTYQTAKAVDNATGASDKAAASAKKAVTDKIDATKKQVKNETDAWKDILK